MRPFRNKKWISYLFLKLGRVLDAHFLFLIGIWSRYIIFVFVYIKCVFVLDAGNGTGTRQLGGATGNRCYVWFLCNSYNVMKIGYHSITSL